MSEMSSKWSLVTVFIVVGVLAVFGFTGYKFAYLINEDINPILLSGLSTATLLFLALTIRAYYMMYLYYSNRFKLNDADSGVLHVAYLDSKKMSLFQLIVFLFKPMRYIEIGEFSVTHQGEKTLTGELKVVDERLFLNNHYLMPKTELFDFIGDNVELTVSGNLRQIIEGSLKKYEIVEVKRLTK